MAEGALWSLTATEVRAGIAAGRFSAREVVQATLGRMDAVNGAINAVVDRCDAEALAAADAVDRAVAQGADPGSVPEVFVLCHNPVSAEDSDACGAEGFAPRGRVLRGVEARWRADEIDGLNAHAGERRRPLRHSSPCSP